MIRSAAMKRELKTIGVGLLLGLLGLVFGIFWAIYLTANHERIHETLALSAAAALEEKFVTGGAGGHEWHSAGAHDPADSNPAHEGHDGHGADAASAGHAGHAGHGADEASQEEKPDGSIDEVKRELAAIRSELSAKAASAGMHGAHASPEMAEAHKRLARGHLHAMGLGVLTIAVSLMLAFIPGPGRLKTIAAACVGTGGVFYPLAWIVMGYRTTALGAAAAEASVLPMAAFSMLLAAAGLLVSLALVIVWLVRQD